MTWACRGLMTLALALGLVVLLPSFASATEHDTTTTSTTEATTTTTTEAPTTTTSSMPSSTTTTAPLEESSAGGAVDQLSGDDLVAILALVGVAVGASTGGLLVGERPGSRQ